MDMVVQAILITLVFRQTGHRILILLHMAVVPELLIIRIHNLLILVIMEHRLLFLFGGNILKLYYFVIIYLYIYFYKN